MQNPYEGVVGLDTRSVAIDAGHHIAPKSKYSCRLTSTHSDQIKSPTDWAISENFSLVYIY